MKPVRVSQLNAYIHRVVSADPVLSNISVIGEISNFKHHNNGHVYFSLKDATAKVNCFLPGGVFAALPYEIGDDIEVTASGYINVYEKGGTYSLNIRELTMEGAGNLAAAFEKLKEKLTAEGLFDPSRKKPLPAFPHTVAIVTSGTGAAIEDMLKIITAKNAFVDILIYPTLVQGPGAAAQIAAGIAYINEAYPRTDVIITGRGGGSVEELWAFNEETVARAIFASAIPVISAVGHETDVTIADFVADRRAETPTAAADMAVPDMRDVRRWMDHMLSLMTDNLSAKTDRMKMRIDACALPRLGDMLLGKVNLSRAEAERAAAAMQSDVNAIIERGARSAELFNERLRASDPARIMSMGYAALLSGEKNIRSVADLSPGDKITARMADGSAELTVEGILPGPAE
ncbi:MAG: exodeoxyribonuclease VII large subunit [Clostridiales Family XIII bacterium]|jgi:exodeoxyribonuclease VII large subunit|nr:exodeoxyribonuclease VII large subunit [Clostridiales Family XIII bacterium]